MKFLIRNTVIFVPNDGLYLSMSSTVDVKVSLIADRLLLLLINSNGEFISKQQLRDLLWQEYKIDASAASVNNNLSFLRKAFKDLGIDDLIVTTPKVGVSLIQNASVIVLDEAIELSNDNMIEKPEIVKKETSPRLLTKSLCFIVFVIIAAGVYFYNTKSENIYISTIDGCKIFSPTTLSNTESNKLIYFAAGYIKSNSIVCKENNIVVASIQTRGLTPTQTGREFFSLCEVNGSFVYSCANYYYLNGIK